jgi:hypothetical protein
VLFGYAPFESNANTAPHACSRRSRAATSCCRSRCDNAPLHAHWQAHPPSLAPGDPASSSCTNNGTVLCYRWQGEEGCTSAPCGLLIAFHSHKATLWLGVVVVVVDWAATYLPSMRSRDDSIPTHPEKNLLRRGREGRWEIMDTLPLLF